MKNRNRRNALGGTITNPEAEFYQDNTRLSSENRLDSNRARIIKYSGISQTYDIQLLYNDVIIKNIASVNIPATPYAIGKEVKITYPHGLRQQPMIDGGIFAGRGDTTSVADKTSSPAFQAFMMSQQTDILLKQLTLILANDDIEDIYGTDSLDYLFPKAKLHSALTGAELHTPKSHNHSEAPIRRVVIRVTAHSLLTASHENIFCDTDGGAITITLPAGIAGTYYRIVNTGSSGNRVTITPNGLELLFGVNGNFLLNDGTSAIIVYESTEGWW